MVDVANPVEAEAVEVSEANREQEYDAGYDAAAAEQAELESRTQPEQLTDPAETDAVVDTHSSSTDRAERLAGGDPRQAVVDLLHRRLDARLRPLTSEDIDAVAGIYFLTRRDLEEVLQDDLPPASDFYGSITTPGEVYVDALCPVCGIATEIVLEVDRDLITHGNGSSELKLATKSKSRPHQHGQLRTRDVPVPGQVIAPFGEAQEDVEDDVPRETMEDEPAPIADPDPALAYAPDGSVVGRVAGWATKPGGGSIPILDPAPDEPLDLGSCPYPGCPLAAEHPGDHAPPAATSVPDDDDLDLLPF